MALIFQPIDPYLKKAQALSEALDKFAPKWLCALAPGTRYRIGLNVAYLAAFIVARHPDTGRVLGTLTVRVLRNGELGESIGVPAEYGPAGAALDELPEPFPSMVAATIEPQQLPTAMYDSNGGTMPVELALAEWSGIPL